MRERVKNGIVAIKLHLGNNDRYSVLHPVFACKIVQAIKDGGEKPVFSEIVWSAAERNYTTLWHREIE